MEGEGEKGRRERGNNIQWMYYSTPKMREPLQFRLTNIVSEFAYVSRQQIHITFYC